MAYADSKESRITRTPEREQRKIRSPIPQRQGSVGETIRKREGKALRNDAERFFIVLKQVCLIFYGCCGIILGAIGRPNSMIFQIKHSTNKIFSKKVQKVTEKCLTNIKFFKKKY